VVDAAGENPQGVGGIDRSSSGRRRQDATASSSGISDAAGLYDELADHYIAFKPTQIKSATGNSGKYDPSIRV
jgi:hypothetical protein